MTLLEKEGKMVALETRDRGRILHPLHHFKCCSRVSELVTKCSVRALSPSAKAWGREETASNPSKQAANSLALGSLSSLPRTPTPRAPNIHRGELKVSVFH